MPTEFVYLLWHIDRFEDEKLIGMYRTQEDADAATERLKGMPGFRDDGGKFVCGNIRSTRIIGGKDSTVLRSEPAVFNRRLVGWP